MHQFNVFYDYDIALVEEKSGWRVFSYQRLHIASGQRSIVEVAIFGNEREFYYLLSNWNRIGFGVWCYAPLR